MSLTTKRIELLLGGFNQSIADTLDGKDITNTGTAKKSLRVETNNDTVRSLGIFYLEFLDTGRGRGGRPPIHIIQLWVKQKMGIRDEKKSRAVAFAVANKIAEIGTQILKNPSKGIELSKKITKLRADIAIATAATAKTEILQKLDKYKKIYNETI